MVRASLLVLMVILFFSGCVQNGEVSNTEEVNLEEKWEGIGILIPTIGFKDNFIVDVCPSLENYAILGPYFIVKEKGYKAINNYYIKYKKPTQYAFFVGKIAKGQKVSRDI